MLTGQDLTPFFFAALVCIFGAYATAVMGQQAYAAHEGRYRRSWVVLGALAATSAIWGDALVALLITRRGVPAGFSPWSLGASFVVTFVMVVFAARVSLVKRTLSIQLLGGLVIGLAISGTYYLGIEALQVRGTIAWNEVAVVASVLVGIVFSIAALGVWQHSRTPSPILAILLFAVAICGDHLMAINAVIPTFDPAATLSRALIDDDALKLIVAGIAIVVLACTLVAHAMNRKGRLRREADRQQLQRLAGIAVEGLVICEGSRIVWINRSLEAMLPVGRAVSIGHAIETLLVMDAFTGLAHDCEHDAQLRTGTEEGDVPIPVRVIVRPVLMGETPHVVVAIRDQRERLRAEAEMQRLATTDALTGLANRGRFNDVLAARFAPADGAVPGFALLSLDLDRFKSVNDTHGHAAGDAVLVEVSARLVALVREGDLVARLGGDEFAILAETGSDPQTICALATRAVDVISQPFVIDERSHRIGISIGVAFAIADGEHPEALKRSADLALYRAKADGRGLHRVFEIGMRLRMDERQVLEQDLRQALGAGEFHLCYQPQVDARTSAYNGAEALLRWRHPTRGLVMPSEFIALAEETRLIGPIGEWVLRTACVEAASWPNDLVVAVNLSPIQFRDPALVSIVTSALAWAGLPGHRLELEITENVLIEDTERVAAVMAELKALGIMLSLDDFGTGYSSLGHLHRFPFDKLKVDRSFVRGIPDDLAGVAIIRTVVALAAGLGMKTTAEGIEDEAQRIFVVEEGCDQGQGNLFGRPMPPEDLPSAFRRHRSPQQPKIIQPAISPVPMTLAALDPTS